MSDREQTVNGKTSEWAKVKSGVPEGALLALLFSDLPTVVASSARIMYADDVSMYRGIASPADCELLRGCLANL